MEEYVKISVQSYEKLKRQIEDLTFENNHLKSCDSVKIKTVNYRYPDKIIQIEYTKCDAILDTIKSIIDAQNKEILDCNSRIGKDISELRNEKFKMEIRIDELERKKFWTVVTLGLIK